MAQQYDILQEIQETLQHKERVYNDLKTFNRERSSTSNIILNLNIRSLNSNFGKLEILIESLKIKPYVIVCTEVWKLKHYQYYKIKGYNIYYNSGNINQNDGVVVYIRENVIHSSEIITIGKLKIINSIITLSNNKSLEISSLYRSHDIGCAEFNLNFKTYLEQKRKISNHIIIGDFNINILDCNVISLDFLNNLLEKSYFPGFTSITRPAKVGAESGTCIDNIFVKTDFLITKALTLKIPITDHYPLFLEIKNETIKLDNKEAKRIEYHNYNKLFNTALHIDWSIYRNVKDPNKIVNDLIKDIHFCIQNSKYTRHHQRKKNNTFSKDWISKAIINSCNTKEVLYNKLKKNPKNEVLKAQYKNFVKLLDKVIKDAKIKFNKKKIEDNRNDPKKLWACINNNIGRSKIKNDTTIR